MYSRVVVIIIQWHDAGGLMRSLYSRSSRGFMHLRIFRDDAGENAFYRLGEFDRKFSSVVHMVRHYSINRSETRLLIGE